MEFCRLGAGQADIASRCLTSLSAYLDHGNFCVYYKRFFAQLQSQELQWYPKYHVCLVSLLDVQPFFWWRQRPVGLRSDCPIL